MTSTHDISNETQDQARGLAEHAQGAGQDVASNARSAAAEVAGTAKEQASNVASTTRAEVRDLGNQATDQLRTQAEQQTQRLAQNLRQMSEHLREMAGQSSTQGPARDLVQQAAHRGSRAADFIESRGPSGILDEVQRFARRRPGLFLFSAAAAGVVVGRMTRAAKAASDSERDQWSSGTPHYSDNSTAYPDLTSADSPGYPGEASRYGVAGTAEPEADTITLPGSTGTAGSAYGLPAETRDDAGGAW